MPYTNYVLKLIMGGNGGVGKTTMLHKYIKGKFKENMAVTIGLNFFIKRVKLKSKIYTLQMWDFGGQDRFRFLHERYVAGANVGVLLFDLTRLSSLENIPFWERMFRSEDNSLPLILIGTKYDLIEEERYPEVKEVQVLKIAEKCKIEKESYIKTSSKTGFNLNKVFTIATELAVEHLKTKVPRFLDLKRMPNSKNSFTVSDSDLQSRKEC
ncbi:MAG: Rab family GTPase [Promethearchaeota archaeon]